MKSYNVCGRCGTVFDRKCPNCEINGYNQNEAIKPNNIRDWYAFNGGEELGITLEQASIIWDAAIKSIENIPNLPNCQCGNVGMVALCQKCNSLFTDCLDFDI